jgi:Spy/CpxP family protein refolding chaperone
MKPHSTLALTIALIATLGTGSALAQRTGPGSAGLRQGRPGMRQGLMAMARLGLARLDLTDSQREQVKTIVSNHRPEVQKLAEREIPARRGLVDAVMSGDEPAIRQRGAEVGAIETDRALLAARVRAEIFKILTPEQQQKAQALRKQVEERVDQRRSRRAGR